MNRKLWVSVVFSCFAMGASAQQQINLPGVTVIAPPSAQQSVAPNPSPFNPGNASSPTPGGAVAPQPQRGGPVSPVLSRRVPNANQQGVRKGQEDALRASRARADWEAMNTPRQRGEVVPVPSLSNPVAKQKEYQTWLSDWGVHLSALGLSSEKIRFESHRLSKEDFARWASRQVIAREKEQVLMKQPALEKNQAEVFPIR